MHPRTATMAPSAPHTAALGGAQEALRVAPRQSVNASSAVTTPLARQGIAFARCVCVCGGCCGFFLHPASPLVHEVGRQGVRSCVCVFVGLRKEAAALSSPVVAATQGGSEPLSAQNAVYTRVIVPPRSREYRNSNRLQRTPYTSRSVTADSACVCERDMCATRGGVVGSRQARRRRETGTTTQHAGTGTGLPPPSQSDDCDSSCFAMYAFTSACICALRASLQKDASMALCASVTKWR